MEAEYKSPLKKLVKFFEESRNKWKAKAQESKQKVKLQGNRIRFLEESKLKLKADVLKLKSQIRDLESKKNASKNTPNNLIKVPSDNTKIAHHSYSAELIATWCQLILNGSISFRAASRVLSLISMFLPAGMLKTPSWHTGRLWLIRLGYYKLTCPKEKAEDWIWIIDHSVQTGPEKCLLILGIRAKDLPHDRALQYKDVQPIELLPVQKSNGEIVYEQLENTIVKTGIPCEIIGDHGSDIKSGIDKFCLSHQETCYIYDIKHKMASLLKKALLSSDKWDVFTKLSSKVKSQVQQTSLAELAPPNQRSKSRYMNTEYLLTWAEKMLTILLHPETLGKRADDIEKIREKFGWLIEFKEDLICWNSLLSLTSHTENFIRNKGIYRNASKDLETSINDLVVLSKSNTMVLEFKNSIINFVKQESIKTNPKQRLLGSSEIIESVFGKQKFIENEQAKSGFTGLLLSLGAIVSETTTNIIQQAMTTVSTNMIYQWYKDNIKKSLQAKRIEIFQGAENFIDNSGTKIEPTLEAINS